MGIFDNQRLMHVATHRALLDAMAGLPPRGGDRGAHRACGRPPGVRAGRAELAQARREEESCATPSMKWKPWRPGREERRWPNGAPS